MNLSIYLFGVYVNSYQQYPNDYTRKMFKQFSALSFPPTQLIIHREGDLMYYGYTRMLGKEHHVGLCAVVNGVAITDVQRLFGVFEGVVETMAYRQSLICVNEKGELCSKLRKLREDMAEVDLTVELLKSCLENMDDATVNLPALDTETGKDDVHRFSAEDDEAEILKYSLVPGYTVIWKKDNFESLPMQAFRDFARRKDEEMNQLKSRWKRQRRAKWLLILALIVLLLCTDRGGAFYERMVEWVSSLR